MDGPQTCCIASHLSNEDGRMMKTKNDGWQRSEYTRPTIIPIYNQGMGGTDSGDQWLEAYRPELEKISWVPRVLTHFLNMAIVNSFIWYSAAFLERKLSHYQFRERSIDDLVKAQQEKQVKEDANIFPRSLSIKTDPRSRADELVLIGQSNFGKN